MNLISIENKAAKLKLNDIVMQPVMDKLIADIGKVFGANAAESGSYTGELTNCFENAADTLDIEIHSPGGSVMDGYVLYNEIKKLRGRGVFVTAHINTLAASMASVIAMAADKITMATGGRMMIHEVSSAVRGNADDLRKQAQICEDMSDEIAGIYSTRSGLSKEVCRTMMRAETWMNGPEAKKLGFIDEIIDGSTAKNIVDVAPAVPTSENMTLLDRLISPSNAESKERIDALELQIASHDGQVSELAAKLETAENALAEAAIIATENKALVENVASLTASIAMHVETIAAKDAEIVALTEAATITQDKINLAAADKLAAQGHGEPVNLGSGNVTSAESADLLEQYENLQGQEKRDFLAKHAVELQSLAKAKSKQG